MSGEYTYYSEGFFGFGSAGSFRPYSWMHLAPLLVCAGLLVCIGLRRERLRTWKGEYHLRFVLAFLMFLMEFGYFVWLLYVGDCSGQYLMMSKLPLHLCDVGLISCMFMMTSKNSTLFSFNFFVTLFGATLACIIPQTVLDSANPAYFRYYQYFGEHLLPILGTCYMLLVHRMRPRYRDLWITVGALIAMLIPSLRLNEAFPGSDYLFLTLDIPFFPDNQVQRAVIYIGLIVIVFHTMWFLWKLLLRARQQKT